MKPEELARKMYRTTGWMKGGKIIVHHTPEHREEAEKVAEELRRISKEMGLDHMRVEIREARDIPRNTRDIILHSWLGRKKLKENGIHVGVVPFEGSYEVGDNMGYTALASASLGGLLAVHPEIVRSKLFRELLAHEFAHLLGLKHEDMEKLPIMNPIRPELDERSKEYLQEVVRYLKGLHGVKKRRFRFF